MEDRFSPLWWFPDVPKQAIGSIRKLENVLPFLRQVSVCSVRMPRLAYGPWTQVLPDVLMTAAVINIIAMPISHAFAALCSEHCPSRRECAKCCRHLLSPESRKGVVCLQLDEELVQDKISAVQRYRSMFIFATQPQHPPSASDMIVELMCTKAKYGLRD